MPYNALEWHVSVQMNVTKAGFSVSYIVLHTCGQPVPQRLISANVDNGTAAGIKRLRRLQTDRLRRAPGKGPLACRLLLLCAEFEWQNLWTFRDFQLPVSKVPVFGIELSTILVSSVEGSVLRDGTIRDSGL